MFPFLESAGGNCQDAVMLVEELALTVKLVGAFEGAAIGTVKCYVHVRLIVWTEFALKSKNKRAESTRETKQNKHSRITRTASMIFTDNDMIGAVWQDSRQLGRNLTSNVIGPS